MLKRLPDYPSILQVYAVAAVMLTAWTVIAFLWKLSAWLLILNLGEILSIFAYSMTANLLESLVVLLLILAACVLLPPSVLRDDFVIRGTILAAGLIGSLMVLVKLLMLFGIDSGFRLLIGPLAVLLLTAALLHFTTKAPLISSVVLWVSDRLTVFLYILVPMFVILSAYVIFRNIT